MGDVVYIVKGSGRNEPYRYKASIEKIGRKYFYVKGLNFDIKTHVHVNKDASQYNARCYLNLQDYYDEITKSCIRQRVYNVFNAWERNKITFEQIKQIAEILGIKEPTIEELGVVFK